MNFVKRVLSVKSSTSNTMVIGECGLIPPSVYCHINVIRYLHRLNSLCKNYIARQVHDELHRLHEQGFKTWVGRAWELVKQYGIDMTVEATRFKTYCKNTVKNYFINKWESNMNSIHHPILRTYVTIKHDFGTELYLEKVKKFKYRNAITRLRTSSHDLEIEAARHRSCKIPECERLCRLCHVPENEMHFIMDCKIYEAERQALFNAISTHHNNFEYLERKDKFIYLFSSNNPCHLTWLGKFIYQSFIKRSEYTVKYKP